MGYAPCQKMKKLQHYYILKLLKYSIEGKENIYLCFEPSLSLLITFPKTIKLLLIYFPSFKRTPSAPVLAILSEPAKSTKFWFHKLNYKHATSLQEILERKLKKKK